MKVLNPGRLAVTPRFNRRRLFASLLASAWATQVSGQSGTSSSATADIGDRVDPWIELLPAAYLHNAAAISKRAGGRPVIAVLKNNAYGLGVIEVRAAARSCPGDRPDPGPGGRCRYRRRRFPGRKVTLSARLRF